MKSSLNNRQERVNLLYTFYLSDWAWDELVKTSDELSPDELETVRLTIENQEELEKQIIPNLKEGWSWDRIENLEKAILLNAVAELKLFDNKKEIVISESNKIAKKYIGDDKSIKLITALLNKIK